MTDELTVAELIDLLQDQPVDAVVRVVHQRAWPLQEVVGGVANSRDVVDEEYDEPADGGDDSSIVFLVADGPLEGPAVRSRRRVGRDASRLVTPTSRSVPPPGTPALTSTAVAWRHEFEREDDDGD